MRETLKYLTFLFLGVSILILTNCDNKEDYKISNLTNNTIIILGHRGMGDHFQYPGNTMESVQEVLKIGADGSEVDVQITKDSVLVLFHNEVLEGRTSCAGQIFDYNWSEIEDCTYSGLHAEVKLISLRELFEETKNLNDYYFSLDCKLDAENAYNNEYRKTFLRAVKKICEEFSMSDNLFIEGDLGFLLLAKELGLSSKGVLVGYSVDDVVENNIFGIGTTVNTSADIINNAHANGVYVMMWGAKTDLGNKMALNLSPDILQTDKPIPLLMLLDRMNFGKTEP